MSRFRKLLRLLGLLLLVAFVAAQFKPVALDNPPVEAGAALVAPPEVDAILRRACYDCHSHETRWPWYSRVAPASWLIEYDVREARGELNFSTWNGYSSDRREHKLEEIVELTAAGEMPLWYYVPLHPSARLSDADLDTLARWAQPAEGAER
ncbi:MAG TPA: heme-binding domain-containing protein [Planctomycetota bacterium]|nr:heme-binding domain-containing protein [Planctomycetota bacterium]